MTTPDMTMLDWFAGQALAGGALSEVRAYEIAGRMMTRSRQCCHENGALVSITFNSAPGHVLGKDDQGNCYKWMDLDSKGYWQKADKILMALNEPTPHAPLSDSHWEEIRETVRLRVESLIDQIKMEGLRYQIDRYAGTCFEYANYPEPYTKEAVENARHDMMLIAGMIGVADSK
jgi:hypothetical protein